MQPADVFPRRFALQVQVAPSGCWEWMGSRQSKHYGASNLYLRGGRRLSLAHQVAMALATGQVLLPGWVWMHAAASTPGICGPERPPTTICNEDFYEH
jgi:hypothetical protein